MYVFHLVLSIPELICLTGAELPIIVQDALSRTCDDAPEERLALGRTRVAQPPSHPTCSLRSTDRANDQAMHAFCFRLALATAETAYTQNLPRVARIHLPAFEGRITPAAILPRDLRARVASSRSRVTTQPTPKRVFLRAHVHWQRFGKEK